MTGDVTAGEACDDLLLSRALLTHFVEAALSRAGVSRADARIAAHVLVMSDARSIPSHGVARLGQYVDNLRSGVVTARPTTRVWRRRAAAELWDADHGLGHPVTTRAMHRAIVLARRAGLGMVAIRDSSHFGIAGAYVRQAMTAGMIGMAMTNADPNVAATGSHAAVFGTNPIAVGAAGLRRSFLLDMATSVVPAGRLEVARRRRRAIPEGWAIDRDGNPSRNPAVLGQGGNLLPLGGASVVHGGHKGFGAAAFVDLLSGVLPDTAYGLSVRSLFTGGEQARVGHAVLAIDPSGFGSADDFRARLDQWIDSIKGLPASTPGGEVLVAGEPEDRAEAAHMNTVPVQPAVVAELETLARDLRLASIWARLTASTDGRARG